MSKRPRVSVLMPVYNTNIEHLQDSINSILNQTFTDFEFIILNDSPDNTELEKFITSNGDKRIKYHKNEKNIGISESRNRLLELAHGEYIAIFDHDDISVPDRLACQVEFLDTHPNIGVVSGLMECFDNRTDIWQNPETDLEIKLSLTENCFVAHTAAMIRKSILIDNKIKYESEYTPAEDYRLWTRLMNFTNFYNIQRPLVKYRIHSTNTSKTDESRMIKSWQKIQKETIQQYPTYRKIYLSLHQDKEKKSSDWRIRLFGKIPFLKKKSCYILLFDIIPILKIKRY